MCFKTENHPAELIGLEPFQGYGRVDSKEDERTLM